MPESGERNRKLRQSATEILEHAKPNITIIGLLCVAGFPLYYIVWKYIFPQPYETILLRLSISVLGMPWLLYNYLPTKAKKIFPYYFLVTSFIMMPFFFNYMMLKNEWSLVWAMSNMAGLFLLIILIYDWVLVTLMTLGGFLLAYLVVLFTDSGVQYTYFQIEYIPIFLFAIVGSIICNHKRQMASQTKISLLHSLSGSIAHEMRNPLNSIINAIGSLQSILPEKPGKPEKDQCDLHYELSRSGLISLHNVIEESSETVIRANKIIDSILADMQGKSLDLKIFKRVAAKESIQSAISSFSYDAPEDRKLIKNLAKTDFDFFGDKDLFIYILFNLIKNALSYKAKPGFVLEIVTETGPTGNTIRVRDTGPGIPASKRERIFDAFYTSGKKGGIGLGLSFCKRVMNSFGGSITCTSKKDEGAEFILHFPLYSSKVTENLKKEVLQTKNILIADDSQSNRLTVEKYLKEWYCTTEHAENGTQALSMLTRQSFDMILMDLEMPVMTGDEAAKRIRLEKHDNPSLSARYKEVPIIGISSLSESAAKSRVLSSGMNDFISKPLKKENILALFEKYFFSETQLVIYSTELTLDNNDVLVVDDNLTSRRFMSFILERMGAHVAQAENGEQAIQCMEKNDYDIVFMDMEMPVLNGVNATQMIRKGKCFKRFTKYREIPIIALTGNTDAENIALTKQSGMNDHLGKPVSKEDLAKVLSIWLYK